MWCSFTLHVHQHSPAALHVNTPRRTIGLGAREGVAIGHQLLSVGHAVAFGVAAPHVALQTGRRQRSHGQQGLMDI